ncbi:MAG TPA: DUF3108 domain-containing protein [Rhodocyclaceae bacterium]|nr:DUF3108 domain-containing protein [Rhodocyclaceae bacterium]
MPFALALLASAMLHAAALISPAWELPSLDTPEPSPMLDAVLTSPPQAEVLRPKPPRPAAEKQRPAMPPVSPAVAPSATAAPSAAASVPPEPTFTPDPPPSPTPEPPADLMPSPVAHAIDLPAQGRVRYVITRGERGLTVGQSIHTWRHDGMRYTLDNVTETTGLAALLKPARVALHSEGEVTASGLRPLQFVHERVNGRDNAALDWQNHSVAYAGQESPLTPGTQDMLSMYYQLVLDRPSQGALEMPIATGRKLDRYVFSIEGEESLSFKHGETPTVRLSTRSGSDTIELWIARDLRALPLKIRFIDRKGEIFDQTIDDESFDALVAAKNGQ